MDSYDFDQVEPIHEKKHRVTKFREHLNDDIRRGYKGKKQNRKPKRKKSQDYDWPLS